MFTGCGPPSPEVTEVFCRVPSPQLSRSPWYSLPDHLCRFGVRAAYQLARGFSRQHRITESPSIGVASPLRICEPRIYLWSSLRVYTSTTTDWPCYLPASPHRLTTTSEGPVQPHHVSRRRSIRFWTVSTTDSSWARIHGYRNINRLSIDYACRPRLRSRLTLGGLTWPRNPWSFGGRVSHSSFATHACILTPTPSTTGSLRGFHGCGTLPYPPQPLHTPP